MAQETIFKDDLDGTLGTDETPVTTRHFSLGNYNFEIDLTEENYDKLVKALEPFTNVARLPHAKKARVSKPKTYSGGTNFLDAVSTDAVREWAKANGYEVAPRGRIARNVLEAYAEAHPAK